MAQWLHMPWFKRTVVGCFVRVNIGAGEQMGKITYRIAEVRDVSESSKIYNLGMFSGKISKFEDYGVVYKVTIVGVCKVLVAGVSNILTYTVHAYFC